jgi:hypothetical protein
MAALWLSTFLLKALVSRVKRRMCIRIVRFWRSTVLSINLVGDRLRDLLDPRTGDDLQDFDLFTHRAVAVFSVLPYCPSIAVATRRGPPPAAALTVRVTRVVA